jgi:1-acyl-sn-glycerol-3-phosphate acyltransferase
MEGFFLILYDFFKNKRLLFFSLIILILAIAAILASKLRFEEDISKMISGSESSANVTRIIEGSGLLDRIVLNLSLSDTTAAPDPEQLAGYAEILNDSLSTPAFKSLLSGITFRVSENIADDIINIAGRNLPLFLEESDYAELEEIISPAGIREALAGSYNTLLSPASFAMKKMILYDPVGILGLALRKFAEFGNDSTYLVIDGAVFSRDRKHLLMFLTTAFPSSSTSENTKLIRLLDNVKEKIEAESGNRIRIEYFGSAAVAVGNAERLKKDIRLTLTITIILLTLIVTFSIKKKKLFPFIFLPAVFGGVVALAVIYLIQAKISVISLSIGTVILAITVDYALHITTHYKHKHSVINTIRDVSFPIIVCGFATAFEFISLVFVSSESLHELGILAAISVITASFFTMVVMPHILDVTRSDMDETEEKNYLERVLDRITRYDFHRNRHLLIFMAITTVVTAFYANRVGFESDMMKMNYTTSELAEAEDNLNRINNYKLNSIYIVSQGSNMQEALKNNEKLMLRGRELLKEGIIVSFNSPGALLYSDSLQKKRIERWNSFWTDSRKEHFLSEFERAAVETGFKPGSFTDFRQMIKREYCVMDSTDFMLLRRHFYSNNVTIGKSLAMIVSEIKVNDRNRRSAEESVGAISGTLVMDRRSMLSGIVDTLGKDFSFIANVSLTLILIILIIAFGRFELGFITFVPIFVSWVWTLGIMGIAGIKFNIFNIIISSFITGLGIDYSIYIMQGLVQGYKSDNNNLLSYKTCILISVMISISGTGVLILAKHPALNSIALISIIGLLSVVLISYTFEPVLFNWLVSKKGRQRSMPVTITDILVTLNVFAGGIILSLFLNLMFFLIYPLPLSKRLKQRMLHRLLCGSLRFAGLLMVTVRKRVLNPHDEDFSKPAVIVANHQSHIDLPLLLMQSPKIIVLTTSWVWNNPFYCLLIRYLDFYTVTDGYGPLIGRLRKKVEEGYSILVFPEGTRSPDSRIQRFHKGAFLLAEELRLDILPVIIHGAGDCMTKGENILRRGTATMRIFPRVRYEDRSFGNDYHERTRALLKFFREEYAEMKKQIETPVYFRRKLVRNFIYKGPVLEWYTRIKLSLEDNYEKINMLVPRAGKIVDIGCGYGMVSYMLGFVSEERQILGIDYDENKINLAANCISRNERIEFVTANAVEYDYPEADAFILSDVLHYMPSGNQEKLLKNVAEKLRPGGTIIIRDADRDLQKRHFWTRYTEFFSTRFGYNKSLDRKLFFFSGKMISGFASSMNMSLEVCESSKVTSNRLYVLRFRT